MNLDPNMWRLFIDASLYNIKSVLLHVGKTIPSVPVAHAVILREYIRTSLLFQNVYFSRIMNG